MDIWTKPPEFRKVPVSSDSDSEALESPQSKQRKARLPRAEGSRVHRCAVDTELIDRGRLASNQLDRLRGILKNAPARPALRRLQAAIPTLCVVHDPSVDTDARAGGVEMLPAPVTGHVYPKGLTPGTGCGVSLTAKGNFFPIADYQRDKFAELQGSDFK